MINPLLNSQIPGLPWPDIEIMEIFQFEEAAQRDPELEQPNEIFKFRDPEPEQLNEMFEFEEAAQIDPEPEQQETRYSNSEILNQSS